MNTWGFPPPKKKTGFSRNTLQKGLKSLFVGIVPSSIRKPSREGSKYQDYGSLIWWNDRYKKSSVYVAFGCLWTCAPWTGAILYISCARIRHIVYQRNSGSIVKDGTTFRCKYENNVGNQLSGLLYFHGLPSNPSDSQPMDGNGDCVEKHHFRISKSGNRPNHFPFFQLWTWNTRKSTFVSGIDGSQCHMLLAMMGNYVFLDGGI